MVYWRLQDLGITTPGKHSATVEKYSLMLNIKQRVVVYSVTRLSTLI